MGGLIEFNRKHGFAWVGPVLLTWDRLGWSITRYDSRSNEVPLWCIEKTRWHGREQPRPHPVVPEEVHSVLLLALEECGLQLLPYDDAYSRRQEKRINAARLWVEQHSDAPDYDPDVPETTLFWGDPHL